MNKKTDYIDKEEKEIVESYDSDEWVSVGDEKKEELREAAKNSLLKKTHQHTPYGKRLSRHSG